MATYHCQAIVIKQKNYGEADRILTLYTDLHGKVIAIAKGVRWPLSKLAGHLQLFSQTSLLLANGRNWDTVAGAETVKIYPDLNSNLSKTAQIFYFGEIIDNLTEVGVENGAIFNLLIEALSQDSTVLKHMIGPYFELNLLKHLGYSPSFFECVGCGQEIKKGKNYISVARGGVVCEKCFSGYEDYRVSDDVIKLLRLYLEKNFDFLSRLKIKGEIEKQAEEIAHQFLIHILEREPKSRKFLNNIQKEKIFKKHNQ
jgi:DNA repair protein RecO (recombination protein O)